MAAASPVSASVTAVRALLGGDGGRPLHEPDEACLEPFAYVANQPGKNVRGILIDCFQAWLRVPADKVLVIKDAIGQLHNASLLIDDIEDNSKLRRGQPVAHHVYGVPSTLNAANYAYFLALEQVHRLDCGAAMGVMVSELLNLHRGQGQDILWRDSGTPPSEEQYRQMILDKTGGLFRLAIGLLQAFSECRTDFVPLVDSLALYFQIRDDYVNLVSAEFQKSKSYCEDLTEGKFSFPILLAIHANPADRRLLNILRQRTEDVDVKRHAVEYIASTGAFERTGEELERLKAQTLAEIERLGGHPGLVALIEELHRQSRQSEAVPDDAPVPPPPQMRRIDSTS